MARKETVQGSGLQAPRQFGKDASESRRVQETAGSKTSWEKYKPKLAGGAEKQFLEFLELLETAKMGKGSFDEASDEFSIFGEREFSKLVSDFYLKNIVPSWTSKKSEKLEKTVEKQLKIIEDYENQSLEYQKKGKWIFKNLGRIEEILQKIRVGGQVEGVNIKRKSRYMITLEM